MIQPRRWLGSQFCYSSLPLLHGETGQPAYLPPPHVLPFCALTLYTLHLHNNMQRGKLTKAHRIRTRVRCLSEDAAFSYTSNPLGGTCLFLSQPTPKSDSPKPSTLSLAQWDRKENDSRRKPSPTWQGIGKEVNINQKSRRITFPLQFQK